MNRFLFICCLILLLPLGRVMQVNDVSGYGFILLALGTILTSQRRYYLGLKPWWGAPLKDIPKYFKES